MTRRHGQPQQSAASYRAPLTRTEKLKKIRSLIRQNRLPVWADPYFPSWVPAKASKPEELSRAECRQKELKDFREWYMARDHGRYASVRQENREKQEVREQLHYDKMEIPTRMHELQMVLTRDANDERKGLEDYMKTQPTELEAMRKKTQHLNDRHEKEQREFVQTQYVRQWKNSTGAEGLRTLQHLAHKDQSVRDLNEILFFKLLEDFEDHEVNAYFVKLGLDRVAQEKAASDAANLLRKQFELRGQAEVVSQMGEHLRKKEAEKRQKAADLNERLHLEECTRFDNFKEAFEDREKMQEFAHDFMGQKGASYRGQQQRAKLIKEAAETDAWTKQMTEEAEEKCAAIAKSKAVLYQRHLDQDAYNMALIAASSNTALDEFAAQHVKDQNLDYLYNYLDYTKTKQSLQVRCDKENKSQIDAREAEKQAEIARKAEERKQMDKEEELARFCGLEAAEKKQAAQQKIGRILKIQSAEKKERKRLAKKADANWANNFEKQRAIENAHIEKLSGNILFAKKFSV